MIVIRVAYWTTLQKAFNGGRFCWTSGQHLTNVRPRPPEGGTSNKEEPMKKAFMAAMVVAASLVAVDSFYEHPTRGRGLKALLAVIQAGEAL
jgi:hypothetical protein